MKPIIYTTPTCMYCHALMEWFNQNGIEYITRDLTDPTAAFVLAWRIPGTGEPGGLPSMGLHRVGHD